MPDADLVEIFQRLGMALGIGLLMGVERGWRYRDAPEGTRAAGLRTHAIIGLLGGVCGVLVPSIGQTGFAALTIAFGAALIAFKLLESARDQDVSVTGTLAALLVFVLGVYCMHGDLRIAAAVGVTLVALMAFKQGLHNWLDRLTWGELRSALLILGATAVALPLLPNEPIDPFGVINPRELWLLTILVAGASFAGYIAVRAFGGGAGLMAGAAVGALVSSTVVTAELGRRVRAAESSATAAAAAASLAAAISVTRVALFIGAAASAAAPMVWPPLACAVIVFLLGAWALQRHRPEGQPPHIGGTIHSPLDLLEVGRFALLLGGVIVLGRFVAEAFGEAGLLPFAASVGLADVDAVALAVGSLVRGGLDVGVAGHAILLAVLVNTFSKALIAGLTGGWRYGGLYFGVAVVAAGAGAGIWAVAPIWLTPMFSFEPSHLQHGFG